MIKNITLGQYFPGNSVIHRLDARMKLVLVIAVIVLIFMARTVIGNAVVLAFLTAVIIISRISIKFVLRGIKPLWFIILL
ncbi:MAG: energy-coupling factor transporter transmembrane protein EcfT, partial [Christensenellaceae bacterium]|nr:energy-coupling factor transporter transmembrane protein EcfT [Christensenellaceae bacterium]